MMAMSNLRATNEIVAKSVGRALYEVPEAAGLISEHGPTVLRFLRRSASDADDVSDLYQQTWVSLFEHHAQFRGEGSINGWLLRLARTVGLRHLRRRQRDVRLQDSGPESASGDLPIDEVLAREDDLALAYEMIDELPRRQRMVFLLRVADGLSTKETAGVLDCKPGTVKATLYTALRRLRADPRSHLLRP
jgi:RNA polymerase sigma-70 factor (ECF subfamily)